MSSTTLTLVYDNSSDANFKAWAKAISDQLTAFGWQKTTDTGQLDWNTITRPTGASSAQGYEIWRMDDTLQASAPVFLKIEYGSGSSNALHPGVWLALGTGSSGAGVLTGNTTPRLQLSSNGNTTTAQVMKYAGANNRFVCALAPEYSSASAMIAFGIERDHANDGTDTNVSANLFAVASTGTKVQQVLPKAGTGAAPAQENSFGCVTPASASSIRGTDFGLFPIYPFLGRQLNPLRNAVVYFGNEITGNTQISASHYGIATTLYTIGGTSGGFSRGTGSDATASRLAIRFD